MLKIVSRMQKEKKNKKINHGFKFSAGWIFSGNQFMSKKIKYNDVLSPHVDAQQNFQIFTL